MFSLIILRLNVSAFSMGLFAWFFIGNIILVILVILVIPSPRTSSVWL